MISPKQVRDFNRNFGKVLGDHDKKLLEMDWEVWFKQPQTQAILDHILLREMAAQFFMAECDSNSAEFVKKFARFQGNYEALKDLSNQLTEFQFPLKEEKSEKDS